MLFYLVPRDFSYLINTFSGMKYIHRKFHFNDFVQNLLCCNMSIISKSWRLLEAKNTHKSSKELIRHRFFPTLFSRYHHSILWQYGLWSFQTGGTKLERFLTKNQHTQRKLLNFENWTNGGPQKLAKIRVFKVD